MIIVAALFVATVGWTLLTLFWPPLDSFDLRTVAAPLDPGSVTAEIGSAFALLTWPGLLYGALGILAVWAFRRRLRQLSAALWLTIVLGWGLTGLLQLSIRRHRPDQALDVITAVGYSYPSAHLVAVVASTIAVGATLAVARRSPAARLRWTAGASALVAAVGFDRWLLGAEHVSDLVGGALIGALSASVALVVAGVSVPVPHKIVQDMVRDWAAEPAGPTAKRCAVIYNPVRVTDWPVFRRRVGYELRVRGWQPPLWLETTAEDSGRAMTEQAIAAGVDLVLGAGGDGTVRVICSALAGTGIPFGLIPAGTGNLLARNIGIPLDESAALRVALEGAERSIDLVKISVDGRPPEHFAVMAGIGLDAVIMQSTSPDLKKAVGSAAYFVAAARSANHPPLHVTVQVDDQPPFRRRSSVLVIGNVGLLSANILLIPDAKPDDGLLDLLIASPRSAGDWVRLTTQVLTRRQRTEEQLVRLTGRRVRITVEERDHYQLDGDTVGTCSLMVAEVQPAALALRVPPGQLPAETTAETLDAGSAPAGPAPVGVLVTPET